MIDEGTPLHRHFMYVWGRWLDEKRPPVINDYERGVRDGIEHAFTFAKSIGEVVAHADHS